MKWLYYSTSALLVVTIFGAVTAKVIENPDFTPEKKSYKEDGFPLNGMSKMAKDEHPSYKQQGQDIPKEENAPHIDFLSSLRNMDPVDLCLLGCRMCFGEEAVLLECVNEVCLRAMISKASVDKVWFSSCPGLHTFFTF